MGSWLALLRGINVGGHKKIPMADLRELFGQLGYAGARTYIQSGNIVFTADDDAETLRGTIEKGIAEAFGFDVPVMVRSLHDIDATVSANPFTGRDLDPSKLVVTFLSAPVSEVQVPAGYPEEAEAAAGELFIFYPNGQGKSKLDRSGFWKQLGIRHCTTRNWRTVNTVLAMMRE